jgi:DNA replication protein DnaD
MDRPFDRTHAWIDLLMLANHEEKKIILGNETLIVERGTLVTSEVKLSIKWGWSRAKVRAFLHVTQTDGMLIKKSTSKYTSITIANYSFYQDVQPTESYQKNIKKTSKRQQKNTNKNVKKIKNDKEDIINNIIGDFSDNLLLIKALEDFIEMRNLIKKPLTDNAIKLIFVQLDKLAINDDDKITILNNSILNSWPGVYELKGGDQTGKDTSKDNGEGEVEYDFSEFGG